MNEGLPPTVLGTCCVPWRDDGKLDESAFRESIHSLHARGMRHLYIFGTAGEGHAVSDGQYRDVVAIFVEELRPLGAEPMVGVINSSLSTVLERIDFLQALGVRLVQISLPNWGALADTETKAFFRETCDVFPDMKFMHYNLARAGRILRPQEYAELADRHPNLVATKYGAGEPEMVAGLMRTASSLTHFFTELGYLQGATLGRCGLLSSISSINPSRAWDYFTAGVNRDWQRLVQLHAELAGIMVAARECMGAGRIDGVYDKVIAKVAKPDFPLRLLAPYQGAAEDEFECFRRYLADCCPTWLPGKRAAAPTGRPDLSRAPTSM